MAVDAKQLLEYLGYNPEEVQSIDDLKPKFESEFVRKNAITEDSPFVQPILGKVFGTQESELKKLAKSLELDIDFESEDFRANKKVTDKTKFVISKLQDKKEAAIAELKKQAAQGGDEKLKDFQTKYEKLKQDKSDLENLLNSTKGEYESFKEKAQSEVKNVKLDIKKKDSFGKIKFKPGITDFEKKGYYAVIQEQYQFDLDEDETVIVKDKEGKRIPSSKVVGTFKSIDEILTEEAVKGNVYELNKDGGQPKQNSPLFASNSPEAPKPVGINNAPRQIAPRME